MTFAQFPSPQDPTRYAGPTISTIPAVSEPRAPTITDRNYPLFTIWRNSNRNATLPDNEGDAWILVRFDAPSSIPGELKPDAIWQRITTGTVPGGTVLSLSDTLATQVFPDGIGNIQLVGGAGINIVSNPPSNLLTFSIAGGQVVEDLTPDVGANVVPNPITDTIILSGQNPASQNGIETYNIAASEMGFRMKSPFTIEDFTFQNSVAATPRTLTVNNTDANAASSSIMTSVVAAASAADPYYNCAIATNRSYAFGIDNSDSDSLKITTDASSDASPSSATVIAKSTTAGAWTYPLQPMVVGRLNASVANVTGNSTDYTVLMNSINDPVGIYNAATGIITVPVTGFYLISAMILFTNITVANTQVVLRASTTSFDIDSGGLNPGTAMDGVNELCVQLSHTVQLTAADTVKFVVNMGGGAADTVGILGVNPTYNTWFSLKLVC